MSISINELTISLVSECCPRKLICHLRKELGYQVFEAEEGIYQVTGNRIPIQIIVTRQLTRRQNLWLRSLTAQLEETEDIKDLLEEYGEYKNNNIYINQ